MALETTIDVMLIDKNQSIRIWDKTGTTIQLGDGKWGDTVLFSSVARMAILLKINNGEWYYYEDNAISSFENHPIQSNVGLTLTASDFKDQNDNPLEYFPDGVGTFIYQVMTNVSVQLNEYKEEYMGFLADITDKVVNYYSVKGFDGTSIPIDLDKMEVFIALDSLWALGKAGYVEEFIKITEYLNRKTN